LFTQAARCAVRRAEIKAGNNIAAKMAMIAITTNNSINVNPRPPPPPEPQGDTPGPVQQPTPPRSSSAPI
jgi:hypothetical protein